MTANSYYDQNDYDNPIKYYIDFSSDALVVTNRITYFNMRLVPTTINYLNGTSRTIYQSEEMQTVVKLSLETNVLLTIVFKISPRQYTIEQMINYQPIVDVNNTRRMLDTTQTETVEKDNDSVLYQIFFILSQLGGFYSFLKLIFGSVINKLYESMLMVDLVNKYNEVSLEEKARIQDSQRVQQILVEEQKVAPRNLKNLNNSAYHEGGEDEANDGQ